MNHSVQSSNNSPGSEDGPSEYKKSFLHSKFLEILQKHSGLNPDQAFYLEYCKLYIQVVKTQDQIHNVTDQIKQLRELVEKQPVRPKRIFPVQYSSEGSNTERHKRIRRTANQITRHYICQVEKCQKSYGSEGSLNQHIKLKHSEIISSLGYPFNQEQ